MEKIIVYSNKINRDMVNGKSQIIFQKISIQIKYINRFIMLIILK